MVCSQVNINNDDYQHAFEYTLSRIAGIVVGISTSHIAHLLVFPKSATRGALQQFGMALTSLVDLAAQQAQGPGQITVDTPAGATLLVMQAHVCIALADSEDVSLARLLLQASNLCVLGMGGVIKGHTCCCQCKPCLSPM